MRSPITKLAAAAVIIIAVLAGIYFITGKTPAVTCCAWAQIADKVEQTKSCVCSVQISRLDKNTGQPEQQIGVRLYLSSDYGYRIDNFVDGNTVQQIYVALRERAIVATMPPKKQYMRFMITDKILSEIMKQFPDPRDIMAKFMSGEHKELGRSMLDGVEVQGIEATMLGVFKGRMWVDIATEYPVRVEMETQKDTWRIFIVVDGFEWNAELAPGIFEPNIPADFTTLGEVKLGGRDEADAIEGLRMFAEVTDGNYPGSMDMTAMVQEAQETLRKKMNLAPNVEPNAEEANQITQKMTTIRETFIFYNNLVQRGKAPAYYGRDVTAGDANAILMRWKATHGSIAFGILRGELAVSMKLSRLKKRLRMIIEYYLEI